jgi:HEAT repeat protein
MPAYRQLVAISFEGVDMGILDLFKPNVEKMKAKKDVKGLIKALKYKRDQDVRRYAALTLGEIGDARAVEPLIQALKEENKGIRWNAVGALDKLGWKPEDDIEKALYLIAKEEWDKLVKLGEPAVEPLIQALKDKDINVRRGAAETLGKTGDARAVEPLIQALKEENEDIRRNAALALGEIGNAKAVEPLIQALKDEDRYVRRYTAWALGGIGEPAVESLILILKDKDNYFRSRAAETLGGIGEPAVEPLIQALKDKDVDVRKIAAETLGEIGDARVVGPLIQSLKDEDGDVRRNAEVALGKIRDVRAVEPLAQALKDEDCDVRWKVAGALDKLSWKPEDDIEKAYYLIAKEQWDKLVKLGEPAVKPLIQALKDKDIDVRKRAAEVLIGIGKPAVERLIRALKNKDRYVRKYTAWILGEIGDIMALEPLNKALNDGDNLARKALKVALEKIQGKET